MLAALTSPEEVARSRHAALTARASEKLEAEQPLVPEELALLRRAIVESGPCDGPWGPESSEGTPRCKRWNADGV